MGKAGILSLCLLAGLLLYFAPLTWAEDSAAAGANGDLAARVKAIEAVVERQNQTIEIQQRQIGELKAQGEKSTDNLEALQAKMDKVDKEKKKAVELPSWMDGLTFSGDLRLRYEGIWLNPRSKTKFDDQRGRFRVRFGFMKKLNDDWDMGFRLASGADNTPTTANQTMTSDFAKKPVWIDLAYVTYHPTAIPGLVLCAGKFKNPYVNTDMVWSTDVNPEGVYETYKVKIADTVEPFITLGQNVLSDSSGNDIRDSNLMAYQGGANVYFTKDVVWTSAATYYDFINYGLKGNFLNARGNTTTGPGGTLLAARDFNVFDFTNIVKFPVAGIPVAPYVDYAKNFGDKAIINGSKRDTAWAVGAQAGAVKNAGDWSVLYKYARIEPDAVVGAITDDPFGFANTQGHKLSASYGVAKNTALTVSLFYVKPVVGPVVKNTTLQTDLVVTF